MTYEEKRAIYEANLADAEDKFFNARPDLERTRDQERLFQAGFRMAWDLFHKPVKQDRIENDHY